MSDPSCPVVESDTACGLPLAALGLCDKHYRRQRKHGSPHAGAQTTYASTAERFLAKVDRRGDDECWPWTARVLPNGYPIFWLDGKHAYAHRVAYELFVGPIPNGHEIDHVRANGCSQRDCVNWLRHLEPVTHHENNRRSDSVSANQARQTHCLRGHEFTPENTYNHRGKRACKRCRELRKRR